MLLQWSCNHSSKLYARLHGRTQVVLLVFHLFICYFDSKFQLFFMLFCFFCVFISISFFICKSLIVTVRSSLSLSILFDRLMLGACTKSTILFLTAKEKKFEKYTLRAHGFFVCCSCDAIFACTHSHNRSEWKNMVNQNLSDTCFSVFCARRVIRAAFANIISLSCASFGAHVHFTNFK